MCSTLLTSGRWTGDGEDGGRRVQVSFLSPSPQPDECAWIQGSGALPLLACGAQGHTFRDLHEFLFLPLSHLLSPWDQPPGLAEASVGSGPGPLLAGESVWRYCQGGSTLKGTSGHSLQWPVSVPPLVTPCLCLNCASEQGHSTLQAGHPPWPAVVLYQPSVSCEMVGVRLAGMGLGALLYSPNIPEWAGNPTLSPLSRYMEAVALPGEME